MTSFADGQRELARAKANDAATVMAALKSNEAEAPDRIPQGQTRQFMANTAWKSPAGTIFEFQANGKGKRSFNGRDETNLVWSIRPGGLVEVKGLAGQGQGLTMWIFRFESKTEAYYGSREDDVTHKLQKLR
jgi:hypothetical protein